ncbi:hypothetical protein [Citricoccus muralis]|uniref:Abi-like protein n=1 Tax=Citricoccus muralis TaxID=169134 RepID=A0ABY8H898_9MICC|nr:hypothetical protein [Citricoccus muralis]WFP16930.1 hypothetical protein P8192_02055 [Citricoccus muralis]
MYDTLEPHLTAMRLTPYLAAEKGHRKNAIRLYQWNIELSGAVYQALHVVEVVLRNAIDEQLCRWNATQINSRTGSPLRSEWLLDPAPLLTRLVRAKELDVSRRRAEQAVRQQKRPVAHADLLAQLSFGTWRFLLPDKDAGRKLLWEEATKDAFPYLERSPAELVKSIDGIYRLRNRVAHLEPLLNKGNVRKQFENMRTVLREIDPDVEKWFVSIQKVTTELRNSPR